MSNLIGCKIGILRVFFLIPYLTYVYFNWKLNNLGYTNAHRCVLRLTFLVWNGFEKEAHFCSILRIYNHQCQGNLLNFRKCALQMFIFILKWAKLTQKNNLCTFSYDFCKITNGKYSI